MVGLVLFYGLAKLFELFDHQVYQALGGVVSGHALKHLFAAGATACVLVILYRRRVQGVPASPSQTSIETKPIYIIKSVL
jgi:hypothetical protein